MKKKSFLMLLCAVLVVSSAAFGTVAYLTDRASVKNTFTVGNVNIILDETKTDPSGVPVQPEVPGGETPRTEEGNQYKLVPDGVYVKDPTLTVKAGSEESFVRLVVTVSHANELSAIFADLKAKYPDLYPLGLPQEHVQGWDPEKWPCVSMQQNAVANSLTLEFRYPSAVQPQGEDLRLPSLFELLVVPDEITGDQLQSIAGMSIDVVAQAIQSTGFPSQDAAWAAFDRQNGGSVQPTEVPPLDER